MSTLLHWAISLKNYRKFVRVRTPHAVNLKRNTIERSDGDVTMDTAKAKELLAGLAEGVNPLTGEILPDDSICNQPEIVRALHTVLAELSVK